MYIHDYATNLITRDNKKEDGKQQKLESYSHKNSNLTSVIEISLLVIKYICSKYSLFPY